MNKNWIIEDMIDFEYKQYQLLAYLKEIEKKLIQNKLFPTYQELNIHYHDLLSLKENLNHDQFASKELKSIDLELKELVFVSRIEKNPVLEEIDKIIDFSLPKIHYYLQEAKVLYETVKNNLHISRVGLIAPYNQEGYLFLKHFKAKQIKVFRYSLNLLKTDNEHILDYQTQLIATYSSSLKWTYENIKFDLIKKKNDDLPIPATYIIESENAVPMYETFLPLAKQVLYEFVKKD